MMKLYKRLGLALLAALVLPASLALAGGNELAYFKIQQLTTLAATGISTGDYIPVYDASAGVAKKLDATSFKSLGAKTVALAVDTSITAAVHEGKLLVLGGAGSSRTMTLPAATGSGDTYKFVVGAVNTSGYVITHAGSDTLNGSLLYASDNASNAALAFEAAAASTLTLNGTTKGGASIGDVVVFTDCVTAKWCVSGEVTETGSETSPWS